MTEARRHACAAEDGFEGHKEAGKDGLKKGVGDKCSAGSSPAFQTSRIGASFAES